MLWLCVLHVLLVPMVCAGAGAASNQKARLVDCTCTGSSCSASSSSAFGEAIIFYHSPGWRTAWSGAER